MDAKAAQSYPSCLAFEVNVTIQSYQRLFALADCREGNEVESSCMLLNDRLFVPAAWVHMLAKGLEPDHAGHEFNRCKTIGKLNIAVTPPRISPCLGSKTHHCMSAAVKIVWVLGLQMAMIEMLRSIKIHWHCEVL